MFWNFLSKNVCANDLITVYVFSTKHEGLAKQIYKRQVQWESLCLFSLGCSFLWGCFYQLKATPNTWRNQWQAFWRGNETENILHKSPATWTLTLSVQQPGRERSVGRRTLCPPRSSALAWLPAASLLNSRETKKIGTGEKKNGVSDLTFKDTFCGSNNISIFHFKLSSNSDQCQIYLPQENWEDI